MQLPYHLERRSVGLSPNYLIGGVLRRGCILHGDLNMQNKDTFLQLLFRLVAAPIRIM